MEAQITQPLHLTSWLPSGKTGRKSIGSVQFSKDQRKPQVILSARLHSTGMSKCHGLVGLDVSCSYNKSSAPILESERIYSPCDEALVLKNKSREIEPIIDGRSIYLVGKTTVGKILSKELGYSFCDIDILVEQDIGISIPEIFELYGEGFFREKESGALERTSLQRRLVVSTGGGAVIRPVNWRCMQNGISIWLDVPLEALARRIVAVGTNSRPLLHQESGDAYKQTYMRLRNLMEDRGEAYANASARVSLETLRQYFLNNADIAAKRGQEDICDISPTTIAIEALEQIGHVLEGADSNAI